MPAHRQADFREGARQRVSPSVKTTVSGQSAPTRDAQARQFLSGPLGTERQLKFDVFYDTDIHAHAQKLKQGPMSSPSPAE